MRIIILGLFLGSALGALAGSVASAYVGPKPVILQSNGDQVMLLSNRRVWEL